MTTRSRTLRAIGPMCHDFAGTAGQWPVSGLRDRVGLRAAIPVQWAGPRTEMATSLPRPIGDIPDAIAADSPPLEPPGVRVRSSGLLVRPTRSLSVSVQSENSGTLVLPRSTPPPSISRRTAVASTSGTREANTREPRLVRQPAVSRESFTVKGTPWTGLRRTPRRSSSSISRARMSDSPGRRSANALIAGFRSSMSSRWAATSSSDRRSRATRRSPISVASIASRSAEFNMATNSAGLASQTSPRVSNRSRRRQRRSRRPHRRVARLWDEPLGSCGACRSNPLTFARAHLMDRRGTPSPRSPRDRVRSAVQRLDLDSFLTRVLGDPLRQFSGADHSDYRSSGVRRSRHVRAEGHPKWFMHRRDGTWSIDLRDRVDASLPHPRTRRRRTFLWLRSCVPDDSSARRGSLAPKGLAGPGWSRSDGRSVARGAC